MRGRIVRLGAIVAVCFGGLAWAGDPVAVLTEIRMGKGEVWVRQAGEADWTQPQPLLALQPGDEIRVQGNGEVVLVFIGGRGTQIVTSANSPYAVQTPSAEAATEKAGALVSRITQFLLGQPKPASYRHLIVRKLRQPAIIGPREGKLLPGPLTFEWAGPESLRYGVRVLGLQGRVWEQANLPRRPLNYPDTAPILRGGAQYTWELEAKGHPTQRAKFHILTAAEADRVQEALALLQRGALTGYPQDTMVLLRAGLLYQEGLYHEARRELLAGISAEPSEPTLHVLLGHIYERVGLKDLAAEAFEEAKSRRTREP